MKCDLCGRKSAEVRMVRFVEAVDLKVCPVCRDRKERQHRVEGVELKRSPCTTCGEPQTRKHEGGDCREGCELLMDYQERAMTLIHESAGVVDPDYGYSIWLGR